MLPLASKELIVNLQTLWTRSSAVVGRSQQLPCVRDVLQAADERPEPFPEETVEAYSPGWGAAHQKHDGETLGNSPGA